MVVDGVVVVVVEFEAGGEYAVVDVVAVVGVEVVAQGGQVGVVDGDDEGGGEGFVAGGEGVDGQTGTCPVLVGTYGDVGLGAAGLGNSSWW